jgi:hypothetical protein
VNLQGQAKTLKAIVSGSGDLIASDLLLNTANVRVTGSSEARVKSVRPMATAAMSP